MTSCASLCDVLRMQHHKSWYGSSVQKYFTGIQSGEKKVKSFSRVQRLCDPMDCSPPGSSIHGIFQARVLEWVAIPFSRRSSWPRDRTRVSCIAGRCFTVWATRKESNQTNPNRGTLHKATSQNSSQKNVTKDQNKTKTRGTVLD